MNISGKFYLPEARVEVTGNSEFANFGSHYISKSMNAQGTGTVYVDWDPNKVAQVRLTTLVE